MDDRQQNQLAGQIASSIGFALDQTYEQHNGEWWLFTAGKPARALKPDEVKWHVERRHKPFVADGIDKDNRMWWADP